MRNPAPKIDGKTIDNKRGAEIMHHNSIVKEHIIDLINNSMINQQRLDAIIILIHVQLSFTNR
jgi:hypothetical protein